MDSTKTSLLEKQPEFPKDNTLKLAILSLVILLSLVIAGILFITTFINLRDQISDPIQIIDLTPIPNQPIPAICSFAPYKRLCRNTLSSYIPSVNMSGDHYIHTLVHPENIVSHSFQLSVNHLASLTNISKLNHVLELRECQVLLNKEMTALNNSVASSHDLNSVRRQANEYLDQFKRIETYQQACLGKLQESGSTGNDEIRLNLQKMRRYLSNCRAVLLNIDPIIDKIHRFSSSPVQVEHNSIRSYAYLFHGVGYDYMIVFLLQYVFLLCILILMLKLW